ncbi:MAG: AraC family transcriptional regulator [Planctomycetaceae bacterium]|nr:AraC family transcriptional regulator [Planctomycetaceae bacterium]
MARRRDLESEIFILALEKGERRFFPTDGPPFALQSEFGIRIAGTSFHRPPFEISRLDYDQHSAYFCLEGRGHYVTPAGRGVINPGEVWLVPAFYPHHYWVEDEWRYVWVHFRDEGYWSSWHALGERKFRSPRIDQLRRVAEGIIEQGERWNDDVEVMEDWVRLLLAYLRRELMKPDDNPHRWSAVLADVWREVRLNPARPWRTRDPADLAHISPPHFNRLMRQIYGMSTNAMLAKIRMDQALTLMRGTDMKLERIADLTGYSSGFALSKAFRRVFGDSPRHHANRH